MTIGLSRLLVLGISSLVLGCAAATPAPSAPCIEVAVPFDIQRQAQEGYTEALEEWKPPAICVAVAERVNARCGRTFKDGEHPFPADADFQYPAWKTLKPASRPDVLRKILTADYSPYKDPDEAWTHLSAQLKDPLTAKRISLSVADIDLWNTGTPEPIYRFAWSEGADLSPFDYRFYAAADLDAYIGGAKFAPPQHQYFLAGSNAPFFFRHRTYLWLGAPGGVDLTSFGPPRGTSHNGEGCEFKTPSP
jgi:hypothetical protein